jgi:hypothetical protein
MEVKKLSEPASKLEREKMIYVNGRGIPVEEDFLTSRQILETAGFIPEQYNLYLKTGNSPNDYHGVDDKTPIEVQNGSEFRAVPKPTSQV